MKRIWLIFITVLILRIIAPFSTYAQPHPDSVRAIQSEIDKGRALRSKYDSAVNRSREAAKEAFNNPNNNNLHNKFVSARRARIQAAQELINSRNKAKADVVRNYGLTIPAGSNFCYDIDCKGECVHGYCSRKCDIKLCEKAFQPQPWGGGGTPGWIATIIKHEKEHKEQLARSDWNTKSVAWLEYYAWQAAKKCAEKTGLTKKEKDIIDSQKELWKEIMDAENKVIPEAEKKAETSLPGKTVNTSLLVTNYSDFHQMVSVVIKDSLGWRIMPSLFDLYLFPEQEITTPIMIKVPHSARIGSSNEIFFYTYSSSGIKTASDTSSDFMFIYVIPTVEVTAGPDTSGLRGQSLALEFTVKNTGETPDSFQVNIFNPLNWPLTDSFFDISLDVGLESTFTTTLTIPTDVPFWTTNLVFCEANSKTDTSQKHKDWLSVRVNDVDICPLLIESPLGIIPAGTVDTPKVWVCNPGHTESFFDVFCEVDLPLPHRDSVKGVSLAPGGMIPIEMAALTLTNVGDFNIKFYTRVAGGDANPNNDTLRSSFQVVEAPISVWSQKDSVPTQLPRKFVKDGGALVAKSCTIYAFQGGNLNYFYAYDYNTDTWFERASVPNLRKPNGTPIKKGVKAGGALVAHGCTIYAFKGGNTNEFWAYIPGKDTWIERCTIPQLAPGSTKKTKVKAGGALVAHACSIYAFKGGNTNEFWVYSTAEDKWYPRESLVTTDHKKIKGGGALVAKGCTIYAFVGGNTRYFYAYTDGRWNKMADAKFGYGKDTLKGIKDGAALTEKDCRIYAFKGGNTQIFGYYSASENKWYTLETIPKSPNNKKVKAGGALAAHDCRIYALKGGNSPEFWCYTPGGKAMSVKPEPSTYSAVMTEKTMPLLKFSFDAKPNPFTKSTTIRYTVPISGKVLIKLYNVSGALIKTLNDGYLELGNYTTTLSTKNLAKGVYFLRYDDNTNKSEIKLIVQ